MDRITIIVLTACLVLLLFRDRLVNTIYPPIKVPIVTNVVAEASSGSTNSSSNSATAVAIASARPDAKFVIQANAPEQLLEVTNENARYIFTSRGGGLKQIQLLHYDHVSSRRQKRDTIEDLTTLNGASVPPVLAIFGNDAVQGDGIFKLTAVPGGVRAEKSFTNGLTLVKDFQLGSNYEVNVAITFANQSAQALIVPAHKLSVGTATPMGPQDNGFAEGVFWYNGAKSASVALPYFNTNTTAWLGFSSRIPLTEYTAGSNNVGWVSAQSQFFTIGIIPQHPAESLVVHMVDLPLPSAEEINENPATIRHPKGLEAAIIYPALKLEPHQTVSNLFTVYAGPKEYQTLAHLAAKFNNDFDVIMSFGFFGPISKTLLAAMNGIHFSVGLSYGLIIILITVIIKMIFWPLTRASTRSAKRMQALQPQLKALQEKYKDDPQKFTAKQWEFYKKNKVNPLSGCLPMLLQVPVFIGFYGMLRSAIELRGQPFFWMGDLSKPDTIFSIPIPLHFLGFGDAFFPVNPMPLIMGVTVFWQASMTPPAPGMDPAQQKMMKYMPLMMLFFMYTQPAGLALYWTVSNALTILQTKITKMQDGPTTALTPAVAAAPQKKRNN